MSKGNFFSKLMPGDNNRGILINIIIVNFFFRIFSEGFRTLLVPFSADILNLTDEGFGLLQSIGGYAAMAVVFLLGIIVDIQFKKITMILGIISSIISAALFPLLTNRYSLSVFFFCFFTVGQLMMMISTNTFIANETKSGAQRTKGFSGNMIARGIASAIGPITFTALIDKTTLQYHWVYLIMGFFGLIALVLVFSLRLIADETPKEEIEYAEGLSDESGDEFTKFEESKGGKKSVLFVQIAFGVGRMLMGFASGIAIPFIGWYMYKQFSLSDFQYGILNSVMWIVITFGYLFMAFIAERVGKERIVVIYWTLVIPAAVGIMLAGEANMLYLTSFFFILRYIFAMTPSAAWNSFLFEWIPPKHRGKTLGLLQTGQRGLRATGTLTGGFVFDSFGARIFPVAMIVYPIAGLIPLIMSRIVKKRLEKECLEEEDAEICEAKIPPYDDSIEIVDDPNK
ncbi:MAG: MFS transporter [Candidatus Heimdallarchaeota archaeon]|nr:MFS transporter [Candidatus Heimdallarchaeota archaeon]MBY8994907.1 MFS transporter [Candidatus Heimdallarchaeota archaeon]